VPREDEHLATAKAFRDEVDVALRAVATSSTNVGNDEADWVARVAIIKDALSCAINHVEAVLARKAGHHAVEHIDRYYVLMRLAQDRLVSHGAPTTYRWVYDNGRNAADYPERFDLTWVRTEFIPIVDELASECGH